MNKVERYASLFLWMWYISCMGIYLYDDSKPLDLTGLTVRERFGHTEAVCDGCGQWLVLNKFYHGDRTVIRQIAHDAPCEHFERIINFMGKYK